MKKYLFLLLLMTVAYVNNVVVAQSPEMSEEKVSRGPRGGRGNLEENTKEMIKDLGLNEDQAQKLKDLDKKFITEAQDARGDREAMKVLMKKRNDKLKEILTTEQFEKMKALRKEKWMVRSGGDGKGKRDRSPK
jgi:Spy/CpxP family protein refolding chaperone